MSSRRQVSRSPSLLLRYGEFVSPRMSLRRQVSRSPILRASTALLPALHSSHVTDAAGPPFSAAVTFFRYLYLSFLYYSIMSLFYQAAVISAYNKFSGYEETAVCRVQHKPNSTEYHLHNAAMRIRALINLVRSTPFLAACPFLWGCNRFTKIVLLGIIHMT
jgi:hypothetical protein